MMGPTCRHCGLGHDIAISCEAAEELRQNQSRVKSDQEETGRIAWRAVLQSLDENGKRIMAEESRVDELISFLSFLFGAVLDAGEPDVLRRALGRFRERFGVE
jgi:hypothetical protein